MEYWLISIFNIIFLLFEVVLKAPLLRISYHFKVLVGLHSVTFSWSYLQLGKSFISFVTWSLKNQLFKDMRTFKYLWWLIYSLAFLHFNLYSINIQQDFILKIFSSRFFVASPSKYIHYVTIFHLSLILDMVVFSL